MNALYISSLNLSQYVAEDTGNYLFLEGIPLDIELMLSTLFHHEIPYTFIYTPNVHLMAIGITYSYWLGKGFIEIDGASTGLFHKLTLGKLGHWKHVGRQRSVPYKISKYEQARERRERIERENFRGIVPR